MPVNQYSYMPLMQLGNTLAQIANAYVANLKTPEEREIERVRARYNEALARKAEEEAQKVKTQRLANEGLASLVSGVEFGLGRDKLNNIYGNVLAAATLAGRDPAELLRILLASTGGERESAASLVMGGKTPYPTPTASLTPGRADAVLASEQKQELARDAMKAATFERLERLKWEQKQQEMANRVPQEIADAFYRAIGATPPQALPPDQAAAVGADAALGAFGGEPPQLPGQRPLTRGDVTAIEPLLSLFGKDIDARSRLAQEELKQAGQSERSAEELKVRQQIEELRAASKDRNTLLQVAGNLEREAMRGDNAMQLERARAEAKAMLARIEGDMRRQLKELEGKNNLEAIAARGQVQMDLERLRDSRQRELAEKEIAARLLIRDKISELELKLGEMRGDAAVRVAEIGAGSRVDAANIAGDARRYAADVGAAADMYRTDQAAETARQKALLDHEARIKEISARLATAENANQTRMAIAQLSAATDEAVAALNAGARLGAARIGADADKERTAATIAAKMRELQARIDAAAKEGEASRDLKRWLGELEAYNRMAVALLQQGGANYRAEQNNAARMQELAARLDAQASEGAADRASREKIAGMLAEMRREVAAMEQSGKDRRLTMKLARDIEALQKELASKAELNQNDNETRQKVAEIAAWARLASESIAQGGADRRLKDVVEQRRFETESRTQTKLAEIEAKLKIEEQRLQAAAQKAANGKPDPGSQPVSGTLSNALRELMPDVVQGDGSDLTLDQAKLLFDVAKARIGAKSRVDAANVRGQSAYETALLRALTERDKTAAARARAEQVRAMNERRAATQTSEAERRATETFIENFGQDLTAKDISDIVSHAKENYGIVEVGTLVKALRDLYDYSEGVLGFGRGWKRKADAGPGAANDALSSLPAVHETPQSRLVVGKWYRTKDGNVAVYKGGGKFDVYEATPEVLQAIGGA